MNEAPNLTLATRLNERNLIESILSSFYILDYGFISEVNADKTVNVTHAKMMKSAAGKTLPETRTKNVEVLTLAGAGFSLNFELKRGDKVLLLGLKNTVPKVDAVSQATEMKSYEHYSRSCLKAIPLCVFNNDAKVKMEIEAGNLSITTQEKIKLNGDSKQLVTWGELNQSLSTFLNQLTLALTTTPIAGNGAPQPTWAGLPTTIDISAAKTTTVVTGG